MTTEANRLMAEALKVAKLDGSFSPAEIGARVGLNKAQAESAARILSNQGVLSLGFDNAANFTTDFRKMHAPAKRKVAKPQLKRK